MGIPILLVETVFLSRRGSRDALFSLIDVDGGGGIGFLSG